MNTEADFWAVYCMDARRRWWVMTNEGWALEANGHGDIVKPYGKLDASEAVKRVIWEVGWVFGVRMEPIDLSGAAKPVTESGESRRLLDGTAPHSTASDDAAYAALMNGETHL